MVVSAPSVATSVVSRCINPVGISAASIMSITLIAWGMAGGVRWLDGCMVSVIYGVIIPSIVGEMRCGRVADLTG
jgi:hypothetical protein